MEKISASSWDIAGESGGSRDKTSPSFGAASAAVRNRSAGMSGAGLPG